MNHAEVLLNNGRGHLTARANRVRVSDGSKASARSSFGPGVRTVASEQGEHEVAGLDAPGLGRTRLVDRSLQDASGHGRQRGEPSGLNGARIGEADTEGSCRSPSRRRSAPRHRSPRRHSIASPSVASLPVLRVDGLPGDPEHFAELADLRIRLAHRGHREPHPRTRHRERPTPGPPSSARQGEAHDLVRSEISSRSDSARAAKIPKTSLPAAVVVSIAAPPPSTGQASGGNHHRVRRRRPGAGDGGTSGTPPDPRARRRACRTPHTHRPP